MLRWIALFALLAGCAAPAAELDAASVGESPASTKALLDEVTLVYDVPIFAPVYEDWILEPVLSASGCQHGTVVILALRDGAFSALSWGAIGPTYAARENATTMTLGLNATGIEGDLVLCVEDETTGELLAEARGPAPLAVELVSVPGAPLDVLVSATRTASTPSALASITLDARWYGNATA